MLCQLYEKQFKKHLLIHQLIKELFPIIKNFNNTELGQIANKAIMLNEYERMIEKDFNEFSTEFQERQLIEIAKREHFDYISKIAALGSGDSRGCRDRNSKCHSNNPSSLPNSFSPRYRQPHVPGVL